MPCSMLTRAPCLLSCAAQAADRFSALQALAGFKALRVATVVVGVGMLLGLSSVLGRGAAPVSLLPIGLLAGAAASAAAWRLASDWVQKFYFIDYVHQEHH